MIAVRSSIVSDNATARDSTRERDRRHRGTLAGGKPASSVRDDQHRPRQAPTG